MEKTRKQPALRVASATVSNKLTEDQIASEIQMSESLVSVVPDEGPSSKKQCLSSSHEFH